MSHPQRNFLVPLFILVALASTALAKSPVRDHDIVAEDYFDLTVIGNLAVSPDGRTAAYTESRWGRGKEGRSSDLWVVARSGGPAVRLTFDGFGGQSPVWSPDGEFLYFIGRDRSGAEAPPRDGSPQVWFTLRTSGEILKVGKGGDFEIGQFRGSIAEIEGADVIVESDGERWLLTLGERLTDASALPPEF